MEKTAIFVDVQNIYYTCRQIHQRSFNYRHFWKKINQQNEVVLANAYAIQRQEDSQIKFQDALRHIGFNVKLKPFIQRSDGSAKGDWDVGITIDIMEAAPSVDKVVLLSGDGDFTILLQKIMTSYQVKSEVYAVNELTADSLKQNCNRFQAINNDFLL